MIGAKMLRMLRVVHESGYVFNNIALESFVMGPDDQRAIDERKGTISLDKVKVNMVNIQKVTPWNNFKT